MELLRRLAGASKESKFEDSTDYQDLSSALDQISGLANAEQLLLEALLAISAADRQDTSSSFLKQLPCEMALPVETLEALKTIGLSMSHDHKWKQGEMRSGNSCMSFLVLLQNVH